MSNREWQSRDKERTPSEPRRERGAYDDEMPELPPNVPPGFLGEKGGINLHKVDEGGPYGTNAGVIQEWTLQTTIMVILLAYILFFPVAFAVLWRTRFLDREQKIFATVVMAAGVVYFGGRLLGWF